ERRPGALYEFRVVTTVAPGPALAPYLRRFEVVETTTPISRVLLPGPGLVLGVRYAGASSADGASIPTGAAMLTGLRVKARRMATAGGSGGVVAKFPDLGAAAFLDVPLHQLFGTIVSLEEVLPAPAVAQLVEEVRLAPTAAGRVQVLEKFLTARLHPRPDRL